MPQLSHTCSAPGRSAEESLFSSASLREGSGVLPAPCSRCLAQAPTPCSRHAVRGGAGRTFPAICFGCAWPLDEKCEEVMFPPSHPHSVPGAAAVTFISSICVPVWQQGQPGPLRPQGSPGARLAPTLLRARAGSALGKCSGAAKAAANHSERLPASLALAAASILRAAGCRAFQNALAPKSPLTCGISITFKDN